MFPPDATPPLPLEQLYVEPYEGDDYDADACRKLLEVLKQKGARTVDDVVGMVVSLEEFFEGNREKSSIATNVVLATPFHTAEAWYDHLKELRAHPAVRAVVVEITELGVYPDGRVDTWPYSDTVWIYTSMAREELARLVKPLEPSEIINASNLEPEWDLNPPFPAPEGYQPYCLWWD